MKNDGLPLLILLFASFSFVTLAQQQHLESVSECFVTQCIAHGVHCAIDVAKPIPQVPESFGDTAAKSVHQNHDVIWSPGNDEGKQNGTECLCCFLFFDK